MTCPSCGGCRHIMRHEVDRARNECRNCGYLHPWMTLEESRAYLDACIAVMRGAATLLAERAAIAEREAA